jgi:hypothetical protein
LSRASGRSRLQIPDGRGDFVEKAHPSHGGGNPLWSLLDDPVINSESKRLSMEESLFVVCGA